MLVQLLADGGLVLILIASVGAGLFWLVKEKPKFKNMIPYILMAGLSSLLVGKLMSFFQPDTVRPFIEKGVEAGAAFIDNPGFPSDHALLATVVVMAVYFLTPYKKLSYALAGVALLMSVMRVVALVHTPLDIVGGLLAGLAGVFWYIKLKHDTTQ